MIDIEILHTSSGLKASVFRDDMVFDMHWWTEGHGACNCLRSLLCFGPESDLATEPVAPSCGKGLFLVRIKNAETGEVLLDELGEGAE